MSEKIVLAYSGGLDTSVMVKWLQEEYGFEVITLTVDLGQGKEVEEVREKAIKLGAIETVIVDAKSVFANSFIAPAIQAGALYENVYPLATALARPLISKYLVDTAHKYGAMHIAHGCTGKGNDQVRFEITAKILDPNLKMIAPVREWGMTRDEELIYAQERGIKIEQSKTLFSVDQNIWGRSIEAGCLEDPWSNPPKEAFSWTKEWEEASKEVKEIIIGFENGVPISLDGEKYDLENIIQELNILGGKYGIGRIDHVENRLVGIKTREIYEAPAAVLIHAAHAELETLTLSKEQMRFKQVVSKEYSEMVYNGLWFSALHQDLLAYLMVNQKVVNGEVRIKLMPGSYIVIGRQSDNSLYSKSLATYEKGDSFDHNAAVGFIQVYSNSVVNQAHKQLINALPVQPSVSLIEKEK